LEIPEKQMPVIDLSTSQEGIIDQLMTTIMHTERPEFEAQKRSIEGDVIHHQKEINAEQVDQYSKWKFIYRCESIWQRYFTFLCHFIM